MTNPYDNNNVRRLTGQRAIDPPTGLLKRAAFEFRAVQELSRAQRFNRSASLSIFEFTEAIREPAALLEDTLSRLAVRILTLTRPYDVVGRWGEQEFAVLFPEASREGARRATGRIVLLTMQAEPGVTTTAGFATRRVDGPDVLLELVREAEGALRRARDRGDRIGAVDAVA